MAASSSASFHPACSAWRALRLGLLWAGLAAAPLLAQAADTVDLGEALPEVEAIRNGLLPEDACKEMEAAGYKCMGFQPAVRFSLSGMAFKLGSAELPDALRKQLDRFAEALRGKRGGDGRVVRIEGHADRTGTDELNLALSLRRAEEVKRYLVERGTDATLLQAVGLGSKAPKLRDDPFAAENRRVEFGRMN